MEKVNLFCFAVVADPNQEVEVHVVPLEEVAETVSVEENLVGVTDHGHGLSHALRPHNSVVPHHLLHHSCKFHFTL